MFHAILKTQWKIEVFFSAIKARNEENRAMQCMKYLMMLFRLDRHAKVDMRNTVQAHSPMCDACEQRHREVMQGLCMNNLQFTERGWRETSK